MCFREHNSLWKHIFIISLKSGINSSCCKSNVFLVEIKRDTETLKEIKSYSIEINNNCILLHFFPVIFFMQVKSIFVFSCGLDRVIILQSNLRAFISYHCQCDTWLILQSFLSFSLLDFLCFSEYLYLPLSLSSCTDAGTSPHSPGPCIEATLFNLLYYSRQGNEAEFCVKQR